MASSIDIMAGIPFDLDKTTASVVGFTLSHQAWGSPGHTHARHHQLMYAISGVMHVSTAAGRWILPPGNALWISSGVKHSLSAKQRLDLHYLYIRADSEGVPAWQDCIVLNISPLLRELIAACAAIPWDYRDGSREARLSRVLLDILAGMPSAPVHLPEPSDPRAIRLAEMVRADLADRRPLSVLAPCVGASPRTIERLFSTQARMSFGAWRNRCRLVAALEYLAAGQPVSQVSFRLGYENASSFITAFRTVFGKTPARYFGQFSQRA